MASESLFPRPPGVGTGVAMPGMGFRMPGHDAAARDDDPLSHTVNVTDLTDDDRGEFEDEFSTMVHDLGELRRRARKRRLLYCALLMVLTVGTALVFTFLGVSVSDGNNRDSSNDEEGGGDGGVQSSSQASVPPPPPDDLADVCSLSSLLSSIDTHNKCQSYCDASKCCRIPINQDNSCLDDDTNEKVCEIYATNCLNLELNKDSANEAQEKDSSSGGQGGEEDLQSLLELAEEVVDYCSRQSLKTPHGRSECETLCSSKLCCFAEEESYNCAEDLSKQCVVHAACENLLGHTAQGSLLPPSEYNDAKNEEIKQQLEDKCSKESFKDMGKVGECHELCQFHLCCFADDATENCYADHEVECDVYGPCAGLVHPPKVDDGTTDPGDDNDSTTAGGNGDTAKGDAITTAMLKSACSPESLANPEGLADCHALCGPHLCCLINPFLKSSCLNTVGQTTCDIYDPCKVLINTDLHVTIPPAPSNLSELCRTDNLSTIAGFVKCEEQCDKAKCCEEPIENCVVTNPELCDDYEVACEGIKGQIPVAPSNINDLCSSSNLQTQDGFAECHQTCERAACCDPLDDACSVSNSDACGGYTICDTVFDGVDDYPDEFETPTEVTDGEVFVPDAPDDISTKCQSDAIQTVEGYTACGLICEKAQCCNEPKGICKVLNPDVCDQYDICDNLKSDAADMMEVFCTDEIMGAENGGDDAREICEGLCSDRECCHLDGPGNCYATDKEWCDEFEWCTNLHKPTITSSSGDSGSGNKDEDVAAIGFDLHPDMKACMSDQVTTDFGKQICRQICLGRECCFLDGLESCKEEEKVWCKEYNLCYIVFPDGL